MYNFNFEIQCREEAKTLAKHIYAILKVGKENAMHWDDIKTQLEHHGVKFEDYNFRDALAYLGDNVKCSERPLLYIRKSTEKPDGGFY